MINQDEIHRRLKAALELATPDEGPDTIHHIWDMILRLVDDVRAESTVALSTVVSPPALRGGIQSELESRFVPRSLILAATEPEHVNRQRLIEHLAEVEIRLRKLEGESDEGD